MKPLKSTLWNPRPLSLLAALLLIFSPVSLVAETKKLGQVAPGWYAFYRSEPPGEDADGCGAFALFNDTLLTLGLRGRQGSWILNIGKLAGWPGVEGNTNIPIKFGFGHGRVWDLIGTGDRDSVSVRGLTPQFIEDFARSNSMAVTIPGGPGSAYPLNGAGEMINALNACHKEKILARAGPGSSNEERMVEILRLQGEVADLSQQGAYDHAIELAKKSVNLGEELLGPGHPDVAILLNSLGQLYQAQGRYGEAEPLFQRGLIISEEVFGPKHSKVGPALNNLAALYMDQGRFRDAEKLYQRALAIPEGALGPSDFGVATILNNLGYLFYSEGRYGEAEPLLLRALATKEDTLGPDHLEVANILNNLSLVYMSTERCTEGIALAQRALAIWKGALGTNHPKVSTGLNNLAGSYLCQSATAQPFAEGAGDIQGRPREVTSYLLHSLTIAEEKLGSEHPELVVYLLNAGLWCLFQGAGDEEIAIGTGPHARVARATAGLAVYLMPFSAQEWYREAAALIQRALNISEATMGAEHPLVIESLLGLAMLYEKTGRASDALELRGRVQAIDTVRLRRGLTGTSGGEGQEGLRDHALSYLSLLAHLDAPSAEDLADSLTAVQLARRSDSDAAFQLLSQRLAVGGRGDLAQLVRRRQDLLGQLAAAEKRLLDAYGQPAKDSHDGLTDQLRQEIDVLKAKEKPISQRLQKSFPAYVEFEGTQLTDLASLQQVLKPDEAALAWVMGLDEAYLLIVRHQGEPELRALPLKAEDITARINQLHKALDLADETHYNQLAAFPAADAHRLFEQLFGPDWASELKGIDHLLLVPEGPLTRLPFATLLTDAPASVSFPPGAVDFQSAPWLAQRFALSVLPSLSALTSLRSQHAVPVTNRPFLGVGDPLLDDHPAKVRGGQSAAPTQQALVRNANGLERVQQVDRSEDLRQSRLKLIRQQASLPDTADELQSLARLLGGEDDALLLREAATETKLKQHSLDDYNILSFATHGVLAGELGKGIEPGLILTPPEAATERDDGFLSLSEVAQLKLNADWVVLSACNTASGEQREAEGLTGLAKAFIYAGTRSLLASLWSVSSQGTVALMSRTFEAYRGGQTTRAEAHRQAMQQMIASGDHLLSHPSIWAPFVMVGEGGESRMSMDTR